MLIITGNNILWAIMGLIAYLERYIEAVEENINFFMSVKHVNGFSAYFNQCGFFYFIRAKGTRFEPVPQRSK